MGDEKLEKMDGVQGTCVHARHEARVGKLTEGLQGLQGCICLQAECLLHPDTHGWNFTSEELWAMNQFSVYPHVF